MMMSPSSMASASSLMTASVGSPALTMISTRRGFSSASRNSAMDSERTNLPSSPCSSSSASVLATERLCSATVYPCRAKLRAMLEPITARPVTPICALPVFASDELMFSPLNLENFRQKPSVTLWHSEQVSARGDRWSAASEVEQALELGEPRDRQRDRGHHEYRRRGQVCGRRQQRAVAASAQPAHPEHRAGAAGREG